MDYDGLGAFRPSNSINDFTSILENNTILPSPAKVIAVNAYAHSQDENQLSFSGQASPTGSGKKRTREASNLTPPKKKVMVKKASPVVVAAPVQRCTPIKVEAMSVDEEDTIVPDATEAQNKLQDNAAPVVAPDSLSTVVVPVPVTPAPVPAVVQSAPLVGTSHPALALAKGNHIVANAAKFVPDIQRSGSDISVGVGSSCKTEESFKGVAQAAVTNLILSAGTTTQCSKEEVELAFGKNVDTSTAHVAALTSNNWVAACAASISGAPPGTAQAAQAAALAAASDPAAAKAARARRATLTADERARQNRDRNREHARNTRLRKKAYVEELKRTLTELVTQRDAADVEKRHEKQRDLEVREVRYRVMEEFLKLRARGSEANLLARWIAILEDGFTLTLPNTGYRAMVPQEHTGFTRRISTEDATLAGASTVPSTASSVQVLQSANQCLDDASKVASFLTSAFMGNAVQMTYHCERTCFMMDGVKAMLDWTLKATPQTQSGELGEPSLVLKGYMRATFSPASNKLASAELIFDTGNVAAQLKAIKTQQSLCPIEETGALLDSVLPQAPTNTVSVTAAVLPSTVSVVSGDTDKDSSSDGSDEEGAVIRAKPQTA